MSWGLGHAQLHATSPHQAHDDSSRVEPLGGRGVRRLSPHGAQDRTVMKVVMRLAAAKVLLVRDASVPRLIEVDQVPESNRTSAPIGWIETC